MPLDPILRQVAAEQRGLRPRRAAKDPAGFRSEALEVDRHLFGRFGAAPPSVRTTEHVIAVAGFPDLPIRIYRPESAGPPPVYLVFFGGAFRQGGIDYPSFDAAFRTRASESGVAVAAPAYALAPEHRYPTPVEQGFAALEWLAAHGDDLALNTDSIAIGGISSGGNIAAAVALVSRDRGGPRPALQLLEVPTLDLTGAHLDFAAIRDFHVPHFLVRRELHKVADLYLGERKHGIEPYASPLRAETLAGLPPAHIFTAECDVLRGDGSAYASRLRADGVDASAVRYLGLDHGGMLLPGAVPAAHRWHAEVVRILRTLHPDQS